MNRVVRTIHSAFHQEGTLQRRVEAVIYLLIALSIIILCVQTSLGFDHPVSHRLELVDFVLMLLFALEVTLRVATYRPPTLDFYCIPAVKQLVRLVCHVLCALRPCNPAALQPPAA